MKKTFLISVLFLLLSTVGFSQSFVTVNGLSGVTNGGFAEKSHVVLYPTITYFNTGGTGAPGANTYEYLNIRVITKQGSNTYFNKLSYVSPGQINFILCNFTDQSNEFIPPGVFYDYFHSTSPTTVTVVVQRWNGSSWVDERSGVNISSGEVSTHPQVNLSNNIMVGFVYDSNGNYIKYHDGTSASPKTTSGVANYFVPYITGAYHIVNPLCSGQYVGVNIQLYTASTGLWFGQVPYTDIYGNRFFASGFEGIQQVNFKIPSNINSLKLTIGDTGNPSGCQGYSGVYSSSYSPISLGTNWY